MSVGEEEAKLSLGIKKNLRTANPNWRAGVLENTEISNGWGDRS